MFVYIVPNGELRGGAWVVLDPSINAEGRMEMYADTDARGGVLEPEGIVEIKMRRDKILRLMERLDTEYASLKKTSTDASASAEDRAAASEALDKREQLLMPTYKQIALLYADLHEYVTLFDPIYLCVNHLFQSYWSYGSQGLCEAYGMERRTSSILLVPPG